MGMLYLQRYETVKAIQVDCDMMSYSLVCTGRRGQPRCKFILKSESDPSCEPMEGEM